MDPCVRRARHCSLVAFALALACCGVKVGGGNPSRPPGCAIRGIDASRHQGVVDWRAVARSGVKFAWFKATEGGDYLDPEFRRNWTLAWVSGVRRGAYHFVYWCRPAEEQAAWFVANVPADPDALPPVLDVEWNPQSRTCPQKKARAAALADLKMMLALMEKTYGRKPVIYAPLDIYRDIIAGDLTGYPLWVRDVAGTSLAGYGDRKWGVLQYAETGSVPGIRGAVDLDCLDGSTRRWPAWLDETD